MNKKTPSLFKIIINALAFPIRVLFIPTEGKLGLSSLKEERMRQVAKYCKGRVLDIGCGPGNVFIKEFIGEEHGVGIDVFPYEGVVNIIEDMTKLPFEDSSFDTLTIIAAVHHIPKSKRKVEFAEFIRVLRSGGLLIITEGEPITQFLVHKWRKFFFGLQGKLDVNSQRGMAKDEEYCMLKKELLSYLNKPPLKFIKRKRFAWGFSNVYIAKKE
ncbi:MAG: class I SAM-dependent methyltransferase [Candidatus Nealsonbacteria bacterium]|nr:class I SAM-dependent methyltransferase [Candidatus Nealsonbacteria bacterium]